MVVDAVQRRSMGRCELCRDAAGVQLHHRKLRSRGGEDTVENLLNLCRACHHDVVHGNVDWAHRHGLIVHSYANPRDVPVERGCGLDCEFDHTA